MPISKYYDGFFILENGSEIHEDGSKTVVREFPIPFQRNRFCNPLGRLLGPKGQTVKWIRRETGCDIIISTNDVKFIKMPSKCRVAATGDPSVVDTRVEYALSLILPLIDIQDPDNTAVSDYQLFHPEDPQNENLRWIPAEVAQLHVGPNTPQDIAPGVHVSEVTSPKGPEQRGSTSTGIPAIQQSQLPTPAGQRTFQSIQEPAIGSFQALVGQPVSAYGGLQYGHGLQFPAHGGIQYGLGQQIGMNQQMPGFGNRVRQGPLYAVDPWANLYPVQAHRHPITRHQLPCLCAFCRM